MQRPPRSNDVEPDRDPSLVDGSANIPDSQANWAEIWQTLRDGADRLDLAEVRLDVVSAGGRVAFAYATGRPVGGRRRCRRVTAFKVEGQASGAITYTAYRTSANHPFEDEGFLRLAGAVEQLLTSPAANRRRAA
jgi:pimeloyl-ACP methyl ester carboxylesterase